MGTGSPKSVEEIFAGAVAHSDTTARRAYLQEACANDDSLLREVNELIAAHEGARGFLNDTQTVASQTESQLPPRAEASELPRIPGLRIERMLGKGGIGVVYEAHDQKLNRRVAIKILPRGENDQLRARILAEARKAAALKDAAIVTIYSVHEDGAWPAINMELVEGFPVDRATASLNFEQKTRILQQIARAIAVAHRAGVIHRDLKPENVIVTPDLQAKVLDFGLALSIEEAGVRHGFFEGTPRYASPEQIGGKPLTPASDVFSFGSLMFKILTGRAAFDGASATEILEAICTSQPPFLRDVAVGVPEDLQAICLACLAWKPEDRPTAHEIAVDLGRYLAGEPVRLRPALYGDILRQKISEYSGAIVHWEHQGMISGDEKDRLEMVHRRILADEEEDQWIIDARRISITQTILYTATWMVVVSTVLIVWLARDELPSPWRWLAPLIGTIWLLSVGFHAAWRREPLASASFVAGAALSVAPTVLTLLRELGWLSYRADSVQQLLEDFSNTQVLAASISSLGISALAWARLKMTGFAWTTAVLGVISYWSALICGGWLDRTLEIQALYLLPIVSFVWPGLICEKFGRVRWTIPFDLISLIALVGCLDVMAYEGPTFEMLGLTAPRFPFFTEDRQQYLSFAANGYLFLGLALLASRSKSLNLRRASRMLEPLALLHMMGPLYVNALEQRGNLDVRYDMTLYVCTVVLLVLMGPWRSSWRMLVGGLAGVAFGSYLMVELELLPKSPFALALGVLGVLSSGCLYLYLTKFNKRPLRRSEAKREHPNP